MLPYDSLEEQRATVELTTGYEWAKQQILEQVALGFQLHSQTIKCPLDLIESEKLFYIWDNVNRLMLGTLVDSDVHAKYYSKWTGRYNNADSCKNRLKDQALVFYQDIEEKIEYLEWFADLMQYMPEPPKIAV